MEVKDLGVHVLALKSGADGHRLNLGHVLIAHAMGDGANNVLMNTERGEVGEAGNEAVGGSGVALGRGLSRVEAGKRDRRKRLDSDGAGDLAQEGGRGLGGDLEMAGSKGGTAEAGLAQYAGPHVWRRLQRRDGTDKVVVAHTRIRQRLGLMERSWG